MQHTNKFYFWAKRLCSNATETRDITELRVFATIRLFSGCMSEESRTSDALQHEKVRKVFSKMAAHCHAGGRGGKGGGEKKSARERERHQTEGLISSLACSLSGHLSGRARAGEN